MSLQSARAESTRELVRERYGKIASGGGCCSSGSDSADSRCGDGSCCDGGGVSAARSLGYTPEDIASLPAAADLGLGCGNPIALLSLTPGEVVLDLGSGAGIDCFLAAQRVGPKGRAIGVDMTPEMLTKARDNARKAGYSNVEFRLGEIEHLPAADNSVDVVISNCVIVLAPDKGPVYREAFRVLRPGGRLALSDMVATRPITPKERADASLWASCGSGALEVRELKQLLRRAGFRDIQVEVKGAEVVPKTLRAESDLGVLPAAIRGYKPKD